MTFHHEGTKLTKNRLIVYVPTYDQRNSATPTQRTGDWRFLYGRQCPPYTPERLHEIKTAQMPGLFDYQNRMADLQAKVQPLERLEQRGQSPGFRRSGPIPCGPFPVRLHRRLKNIDMRVVARKVTAFNGFFSTVASVRRRVCTRRW